MPFEIFLEDEESDWNEGIMLQEYNGVFSMITAQRPRNSEGTVYKKWCFPVGKNKKPIEKMFPMGVRLGSRRQAVNALRYFLTQLSKVEGQDIPF